LNFSFVIYVIYGAALPRLIATAIERGKERFVIKEHELLPFVTYYGYFHSVDGPL